MKNWNVTLKLTEIYTVDVKAKTKDKAIEKAEELIESNKNEYHNDSEGEIEAHEE